MNEPITMGSLFSGFGGFEVAAQWCDVKVLWQSEIETWAVDLLKHRFPESKQLGDVLNINGAEIEPVDIITFGSPCQDMSVAGKRAGLDGERSGLFREAMRIIREMREATNGKYPKYIIWENVPGAFSSNKGLDFKAVLEEITESEIPMPKSGRWAAAGMVRGGKCSISWRVLDAQYWGLPQRRKRIYLVGDYRAERSAEILFKPESLSRYPKSCGKARQGITSDTQTGIGSGLNALNPVIIAFQGQSSSNAELSISDKISPTLLCTKIVDIIYPNPENMEYTVRRLTPSECVKLQGFPENWHDEIKNDKGKPLSDTAAYKGYGNAVATVCAEYPIVNIAEILKEVE